MEPIHVFFHRSLTDKGIGAQNTEINNIAQWFKLFWVILVYQIELPKHAKSENAKFSPQILDFRACTVGTCKNT